MSEYTLGSVHESVTAAGGRQPLPPGHAVKAIPETEYDEALCGERVIVWHGVDFADAETATMTRCHECVAASSDG